MEYLPISELTPYPDNPRKWDDEDIFRLAESIRSNPELFEARPVIVSARKDGTKYVLGGHLRIEAAKRLGKTEVPVYRFVGLTKDKEREILLRDNIQNGEWDWDLLTTQWSDCAYDQWGLLGKWEAESDETTEAGGYSDKNKEIDIDGLDASMKLTFTFTEPEYYEVKNRLAEIADKPENALLDLIREP